MKQYLRVHEVATQLNVAASTVRRYADEGKMRSLRTTTNQRVFKQEYVDEFLGKETTALSKVYYARASDGDKKKITAQLEALTLQYGPLAESDYQITDKSSGLNDKRKGLHRLIGLVQSGKVTDIYVTQEDRLTRFGLEYLQAIFKQHEVTLHCLNDKAEKTLEQELLQDFMSLIASFSGKFYRLRGYSQQKQLLDKAQEVIREKQ